ncbi:MAG: VanW family protein [Bacillota bacterium]
MKKLAVIVLLVLTSTLAGTWLAVQKVLGNDTIVEGVYFGTINLGGKSRQEAARLLATEENKEQERLVTLRLEDRSWQFSKKELGYDWDLQAMLDWAWAQGRGGWPWEEWQARRRLQEQPAEVPLKEKVDLTLARKQLETVAEAVYVKPVDWELTVNAADQVVYIPGKQGSKLDMEAALRQLEPALLERQAKPIQLARVPVEPAVNRETLDNMRIKAIISQFSTTFDPKNVDRAYNVMVAANAVNGVLLAPGQVFSFNKIVGPRSKEAGYRDAPVIINNELVPGVGGGVCQVSTTLYNSVLLAGLEIVERTNHSIPVKYVPVGRDATVTYGGLDFKFRNNRNHWLYLKSQIAGNRLIFKVFGDPAENVNVELIDQITQVIEPKVITVTDPNLPKGQKVVKEEGHRGYRHYTVRIIKNRQGKVLKREVVTKSYYKPKNWVYAVGTGPAAPAAVPAPEL